MIVSYNFLKFINLCAVLVYFLYRCDALVATWGEECNNTDQCSGHSYACVVDEVDGKKKCFCDRFHTWNGSQYECVEVYNVSILFQMLNISQQEKTLVQQRNENEINRIFRIQSYAGFFVLSVVGIAILAVNMFCIHVRRKDAKLRKEIQLLKRKKRKCTKTETV